MSGYLNKDSLEYFSRRLNNEIPVDMDQLKNTSLNRYTRISDIQGYVPEFSTVFYVNTNDVNALDDNLDPEQGYSWSKPFKTIQYAINRASTQIALRTISIYVARGI